MRVPLQRVAHIRAGDKGNTSNVSVIAYELALFPVLEEQLTVARVLARYGDRIAGPATRYVVAPLGAMNFVLQGALGGGVSRTLSQDN
ncbi:MAG: hypothetical protein QOJ25_2184, partial [Solirubrobacteraceae bacterium]|nr:hypothetical protein [Solirubrobacteraceae bacterium]